MKIIQNLQIWLASNNTFESLCAYCVSQSTVTACHVYMQFLELGASLSNRLPTTLVNLKTLLLSCDGGWDWVFIQRVLCLIRSSPKLKILHIWRVRINTIIQTYLVYSECDCYSHNFTIATSLYRNQEMCISNACLQIWIFVVFLKFLVTNQ